MTDVSNDNSPHTRQRLYRAFLEEEILLALADGSSAATGDGASALEPLLMKDGDGHTVGVILSSEDAAARWTGGKLQPLCRAVGRRVFEILSGSPAEKAYVNPGNIPWGVVSRFEIELLARGEIPKIGFTEQRQVPRASRILFRKPERPMHPEIRKALEAIVLVEPRVAFAYLPQCEYSGGPSPPREVLVLVPKRGLCRGIEELVGTMGPKIDALIGVGHYLDIMIYLPDDDRLLLVLQTGCVLAVNDTEEHARCLARLPSR
jgi:hypothetical protein